MRLKADETQDEAQGAVQATRNIRLVVIRLPVSFGMIGKYRLEKRLADLYQ
jgi:hypothetical protein